MPSSVQSRSTSTFDSLRKSRPSIEITLNHDQKHTYTTLDAIEGHVHLTADTDTAFDELSIVFLGSSRTVIDRSGYASPAISQSSAFQTFLKLTQPIEDTDYPQPRVLAAGQKYSFPFTFVVPPHLLPSACRHHVNHRHVHLAHTLLPPSLGDPTTLPRGRGTKPLDDMAPQMCQIIYQIRAKLSSQTQSITEGSPRLRTVAEAAKKVRIVPATDEAPPLAVAPDSEEFCLRSEKTVKKGALRKKLGRITVAAAQPRAFRLPSTSSGNSQIDNEEEAEPPATMTTIHLRFDPEHENDRPPRLGTLWTKLKVHTFYTTKPAAEFPSRSAKMDWNPRQGVYTDTVNLAARCMASVQWTMHKNSSSSDSACSTPSSSCANSRRPSIQSTLSSTSTCSTSSSSSTSYNHTTTRVPKPHLKSPSPSPSQKHYYTATLLLPVSLPPHKSYPPTFHSCLASRTYTLQIALSYHPSSSSPSSSSHSSVSVPSTRQLIHLRVPVQVVTRDGLGALMERVRMEAVIGVEEFFTPRVVGAGRRRRERDVEREREGEPPEYYELLNLNGSGPINVAVGPV